jgi:shikimate kinase
MPLSVPVLQKFSRIVLLGFMGAGKSTAGPLLARRLGWSFYDADDVLQRLTGRSIEELFNDHGEAGFRAMEAETAAQLLKEVRTVIALGGGAIESSDTRSLLQSGDTCTIFLDAPLQTMIKRCELSSTVRPVLKDRERLEERYSRRLPHYRNTTMTVSTEGLSPDVIVDVLVRRLTVAEAAEPIEESKDRQP